METGLSDVLPRQLFKARHTTGLFLPCSAGFESLWLPAPCLCLARLTTGLFEKWQHKTGLFQQHTLQGQTTNSPHHRLGSVHHHTHTPPTNQPSRPTLYTNQTHTTENPPPAISPPPTTDLRTLVSAFVDCCMCTPMKEKTGLFHGAIVALSFAHDIRGSDAWQLGYLLVGGTSAARPCGHAGFGRPVRD